MPKQIITIILLLYCFSVNAQTEKSVNSDSARLKVLTWNIQMLPDMLAMFSSALRKKQSTRISWIISYLEKTDADVVVLQEVFDKQMHKRLKRKLKKTFPYQIQPIKKNKWKFWRQNSGVMFLSKFKIKRLVEEVYKDRDDIDRLADKGCTLIEGEKDGKSFQLAGTHLQAGRKYKRIRELQFSQISKILNIFKRKGIPQILAGDLNTDVKSPEFPMVLKNLGMTNYPICDERPYTSDGINSWNSDEKNPSQIDFVLLNANDTKSEIVEQFIERPYMVYDEKRMDYSDHFGILSIIKL